ncbi:MAG: hypothetical protein WCY19_08860 [Candidatus Gastranaerophilaceae bacterium]
MYIQRIEKTARLIGVKGSVAARQEKFAKKLHADFSKMLEDTFEKNGVVTRDDVEGFYNNAFPNLDIEININNRNSVSYNLSDKKTSIKGYSLDVDFGLKSFITKSDVDEISYLEHENTHLITAVVHPKYLASHVKTYTEPKYDDASYFYKMNLYKREINGLPECMINEFKADKRARYSRVRGYVDGYLSNPIYTSEDKIFILKNWRLRLLNEMNAYKVGKYSRVKYLCPVDELSKKIKNGEEVKENHEFDFLEKTMSYDSSQYATVDLKIKMLKTFVKRLQKEAYQETLDEFFFPQKLKMLEKMLVKEMAKAGHDIKRFSADRLQKLPSYDL